jgi:hypothetical protein
VSVDQIPQDESQRPENARKVAVVVPLGIGERYPLF